MIILYFENKSRCHPAELAIKCLLKEHGAIGTEVVKATGDGCEWFTVYFKTFEILNSLGG